MPLRTLVFLGAFLVPCLPLWAQNAGPVVIFLSENEEEYTRNADAFRKEMGPGVIMHTFSLSGMSLKDLQAQKLLKRALDLKPQFLLAVGQKAFFLLIKQDKVAVVFAGIPDYLTSAIRSQQKKGRHQKINGVFWGDQECAIAALQAFRELLPGARRVGVLYHVHSQSLVDALVNEARKLGVQVIPKMVKEEVDVVPAIRELVGRVDAFLVPKRDRRASGLLSRERLLRIATADNNIPVFTSHASDIKRGALALIDLDPGSCGKSAAILAKQLRRNSFQGMPVIGGAGNPLFQRKFNARIAQELRVARPVNPKWEIVN